jgi:hypothetical protein
MLPRAMRFYGFLIVYTHCFLTFCVVCLYLRGRPQRLAVPLQNFASTLSAQQVVSTNRTPRGRAKEWKKSIMSTLQNHKQVAMTPMTTDELSTSVNHVMLYGPPSSAWKSSLGGPGGMPRVLALSIVAAGAKIDVFWKTIFDLQNCQDHAEFEMIVLVVVVGPIGQEAASQYQEWTRGLAEKAEFTREHNALITKAVRSITVMWMQGSLKGILHEIMGLAVASGVVDSVMWLHPAIKRFEKVCDIAQHFTGKARVSARCLDETQLRNYESWVLSRADGSVTVDTAAATGLMAAKWSRHYCNVIFPIASWKGNLDVYTTMDLYGVISWQAVQSGEQKVMTHSVVVMPLNMY